MNGAFYNEIDPYAANWLRNLIAAGHIAPGVVSEASISDLDPDELKQYTQCHLFAGVGVWSHALRLAGWDDSRECWTGSCPCQPFSAAGQGGGFADQRHLWPDFLHLISICRPPVVIGEQVASKDAEPWIDLVHTDLEALGYAVGAVPFPSAGVGAPHIRDRLYWVADDESRRCGEARATGGISAQRLADGGASIRMGNNNNPGLEGLGRGHQAEGGRVGAVRSIAETVELSRMAHADHRGRREPGLHAQRVERQGQPLLAGASQVGEHDCTGARGRAAGVGPATDARPGPTNGLWTDADWLFCRDGKWRPVEPGTFPLAHGASRRVGRLRAYGNAINAESARVFIEAYLDTLTR